MHGAGLNLQEVILPVLKAAARSGGCTRGALLRYLERMGRKRFVHSEVDDNDPCFRDYRLVFHLESDPFSKKCPWYCDPHTRGRPGAVCLFARLLATPDRGKG